MRKFVHDFLKWVPVAVGGGTVAVAGVWDKAKDWIAEQAVWAWSEMSDPWNAFFVVAALLAYIGAIIWTGQAPAPAPQSDGQAHPLTAATYRTHLQLMFLRPRIHRQKRSIKKAICGSTKIGAPSSDWVLNPIVAQGVFQHATVLWTPSPRRFYAINEGGTEWWSINDTHSGNDSWAGLEKRAERLARFRQHGSPPEGYHPPFGGWALYLDRNPGEWAKYGWQQWHCLVRDTLYREYENAHIFGVYPINPSSIQGRVIILYKDGTLQIVEVGTTVVCEDSDKFNGDEV